jgi:hypothetical protein
MRTEDGRWTYRYDRVLRSPGKLRLRDPETARVARRLETSDRREE